MQDYCEMPQGQRVARCSEVNDRFSVARQRSSEEHRHRPTLTSSFSVSEVEAANSMS